MQTFFGSRTDSMRASTLVVVWALVVWFGFAFFWQGAPDAFPLAGVRGILQGWISGPLFFFSVAYAVLLSIPRLHGPPALFTGAGVLLAASVGLSLYVASSGFLAPWFAGLVLFREGRRLALLPRLDH